MKADTENRSPWATQPVCQGCWARGPVSPQPPSGARGLCFLPPAPSCRLCVCACARACASVQGRVTLGPWLTLEAAVPSAISLKNYESGCSGFPRLLEQERCRGSSFASVGAGWVLSVSFLSALDFNSRATVFRVAGEVQDVMSDGEVNGTRLAGSPEWHTGPGAARAPSSRLLPSPSTSRCAPTTPACSCPAGVNLLRFKNRKS